MSFGQSWFLMQQEGLLVRACLCSGLTALRQSNLGDKKGMFYLAFLELSIGLERMMKLILILEHMSANRLAAPTTDVLRSYGHRLNRLLDACHQVARQRKLAFLDEHGPGSLSLELLTFLDEFAGATGRYANLEKLAKPNDAKLADPLVTWGRIAAVILSNRATRSERKRAAEVGAAVAAASGPAINLISDLSYQHPDTGTLHTTAAGLDIAAKYAAYALVRLIASLREVLEAVTSEAIAVNQATSPNLASVPYMSEFFDFAHPDPAWVMKKRRWP